jgi:hypothetical protein
MPFYVGSLYFAFGNGQPEFAAPRGYYPNKAGGLRQEKPVHTTNRNTTALVVLKRLSFSMSL